MESKLSRATAEFILEEPSHDQSRVDRRQPSPGRLDESSSRSRVLRGRCGHTSGLTAGAIDRSVFLGMGGNQGIRLVSGSGAVVFLSNPLKLLPLRLATTRDLECFFVGIHKAYHDNTRKLCRPIARNGRLNLAKRFTLCQPISPVTPPPPVQLPDSNLGDS